MAADPVYWREGPLLALDKPAGLPVFPPHDDPEGDCLLARLLAAHPEQARTDWPPGFAGGIAHRLDTATSGQIIAAETPDDLEVLRAHFSEKRLDKRYWFLTARAVPWASHVVRHRLAHDRRRRARMVFERGRTTPHRGRWLDAETHLRSLGPLADGLHRWEARMATGVMHQIRIHAASAGLALAGDRLYGGGPLSLTRPPAAHFALHHRGLRGPGLDPPPLAPPRWWPAP